MLTNAQKLRNAAVGTAAGLVAVAAVTVLTANGGEAASGVAPTSSTSTTSVSTTAPTTAAPHEEPAAFSALFVAAIREGNAAFLFERLAPETLDRYGQNQCRSYTENLQDETFDLDLRDITERDEWSYETDDVATTVTDVIAVELERTDQRGETVIQEIHLKRFDALLHWYTDCGTPA